METDPENQRLPMPARIGAALLIAPVSAASEEIGIDPGLRLEPATPNAPAPGRGGPEAEEAEPSLLAVVDASINAEPIPPDTAENIELLQPRDRRVDVYAGVDYVSQYVARGLVFVDEPSVQPWLEIDVSLLRDAGSVDERDRLLDGVSWFIGNWNNITGDGTDAGRARTGSIGAIDHWYEADVYSGFRLRWLEDIQTSLRLNWYTSPSDAWDDIWELDLRISYDDTGFWQERLGAAGFAMTPKIRVAKELHDEGGPEQWYIAPQLSPSYAFDLGPVSPRVTIPLIAGFGANGQYVEADSGEEHTFGFFQTGAHLAVPIDVLPDGAGSLTLTGGVDVIILSDEGLGLDDEQVETVYRFGLTYAF